MGDGQRRKEHPQVYLPGGDPRNQDELGRGLPAVRRGSCWGLAPLGPLAAGDFISRSEKACGLVRVSSPPFHLEHPLHTPFLAFFHLGPFLGLGTEVSAAPLACSAPPGVSSVFTHNVLSASLPTTDRWPPWGP